MAGLNATFVGYFHDEADPYQPRGAVLNNFAPGARTPQQLYGTIDSGAYPLALLLSSDDHTPVIGVAPFARSVLPGMDAGNQKFALHGDVSPQGQLPGLLSITAECFHQTGNVTVLERGAVAAAWAATPVGDQILPDPTVGGGAAGAAAPATHDVNVRRAIPIPHDFVETALQHMTAGTLTWRSLWQAVAIPILNDAAMTNDYGLFLDYLQAASTARPGANADPATEMHHAGVLGTPALRDQALEVARRYLPGLREPTGVNAQLQQVQVQQQQIQNQILAGQQHTIPTLATKNPALLRTLLLVCEVPTEGDLAPYWSMHASLKSGQWNHYMNQAAAQVANEQTPAMMPPILPPATTQDIGVGNFTSHNADPSLGFNIFRIRAGNSPNSEVFLDRNRVYTSAMIGTGTVGEQALVMALDNRNFELVNTSEEFRGVIEGYYCACMAFLGEHNRAVINFDQEVVQRLSYIASSIEQQYQDMATRRTAYTKVMAYVLCMFNDYLGQLLQSQPPTALGAVGAGAPGNPPSFGEITQRLAARNLMGITEVPPQLVMSTNVDGGGSERGSRRPATENDGTSASGNPAAGRGQVRRPNQNKKLKEAWQALGHTSIFGEGSPFRDESRDDNKRVVQSDRQGIRICLPMALRGECFESCRGKHGALSAAEVARVAEAGGLTVEGL